jgi:hypothetical protein
LIDQKYHHYAGPFQLKGILRRIEQDQAALNKEQLDLSMHFDDVAIIGRCPKVPCQLFWKSKICRSIARKPSWLRDCFLQETQACILI